MRLVIVGPGALGCLVAARLAPVACDGLVLLDHRPGRARLLAEKGLLLEEAGECIRVTPAVTATPGEIGPADVVLLCVKTPALPAALNHVAPLCGPATLLVFFQNGISHLDACPPGGAAAAYGVCSEGATLVGPGHVRHAGRGETCLGFLRETTPAARLRLEHVAACWRRAGFSARVCDKIRERIWEKLLINIGINALSAIHGRSNGQLLVSCALRPRMAEAVREAAAVGAAAGVFLPPDPLEAVYRVCRATRTNVSSMLQDVRNRRPTEIDAINGAVVALGRRLGVATPVNGRLCEQVRALEAGYLPGDRGQGGPSPPAPLPGTGEGGEESRQSSVAVALEQENEP